MTFKSIKPRYILAVYLFLSWLFVLAASQSTGNRSIACLVLVLCFESACFATTFTLGLRGLGRHTKLGGSLLVAAISGGAVFPPMTGALATHLTNTGSDKPFHMAMLIPMMAFVLAYIYPVYVNLYVKDRMDERRETAVGIEPVDKKGSALKQTESGGGAPAQTKKLEAGDGGIETVERVQ